MMRDGTTIVFHDPCAALQDRELVVADTHGIAQWNNHRLVTDSSGLGWRDAYTSLAAEQPWQATLPGLAHPCLAYCHRRSATVRRRVDGERTEHAELRTRTFGMIPADRTSTWILDGTPLVQLVYIRRQVVDAIAREQFAREPSAIELVPKIGFADPLLEQLVIALLGEASAGDNMVGDGLYVDHLARLIAIRLLREHSNLPRRVRAPASVPRGSSSAAATAVDAAKELIDASLAESNLSLMTLADLVGLAPHRLATEFRRATGTPLHQYVISRRVERARSLLADTDEPIAQIAYATGFATQAHLTNTFRRIVGTTPGQFRQAATHAVSDC
jgi:AraC family transcriptional regulator